MKVQHDSGGTLPTSHNVDQYVGRRLPRSGTWGSLEILMMLIKRHWYFGEELTATATTSAKSPSLNIQDSDSSASGIWAKHQPAC